MDKKDPAKKNFLKPTLNFTTRYLRIGEDKTSERIAVTELVAAEHLLAHFPNFETYSARGFEKAPLQLGEYTKYSEDEEAVLATVSGYPKVVKVLVKDDEDQEKEVTTVSIEPLFIVSQDKMQVKVALHPVLQDAQSLKTFDLNNLLANQGIRFGIDQDTILEVNKWLDEGEIEFKKVVLARGQHVGKSIDAYLHFELEIGPIAGAVLKDGSIDYRERRIMVGINQDQVIATKIPAVQGDPGINVFGEETPAPEGKDLTIRLLNEAKFSPETMQVTAAKDGVLSVVNNNVIKVLSHQKIHSDVSYETGNIESKNCLTINGSVQPGFKVSAAGDTKISGGVMSGTVDCNSNLVIQGGITGKNSKISASGDVDFSFIEQATMECGGICVIRKQSYYSNVSAGSDLRCKDQGVIVGGQTIAEGDLTLWDVGAENARPALIAAGVVALRLQHYKELQQSTVNQREEIIQWLQRYRGSSKSKKVKKMEQQLDDTKMLLLRVNLIPGTGIYSRIAPPEGMNVSQNPDYNPAGGTPIEKITIEIHGTIYAGTTIYIGNKHIKLEKTVTHRQFRLTPNGKRIIAVPLST